MCRCDVVCGSADRVAVRKVVGYISNGDTKAETRAPDTRQLTPGTHAARYAGCWCKPPPRPDPAGRADCARHCSAPDNASITPATPNTSAFCSENQTSCGSTVTGDDSAAPAPSATSRAGRAQQRVLPLANRDSTEAACYCPRFTWWPPCGFALPTALPAQSTPVRSRRP